MIELVHITKRFGGSTALDDVSLELRPGERLAVIGENGAGKSSLMNVLYGLYQPDVGEVRFDTRVTRLRTPAEAIARGVGMVHQHFTLVPTLTVAENVVLGHEPTRWGRIDLERARREVAATCQQLGFELDPGAVVGELSVGSQQKAEIVKALHRGVKTLILDEPTAVLTPQEADELFAVTRKLSEQGVTVVLISHKLKEVLAFATRIAVMRRGKKVAEVTPENARRESLAALMVGEGVAIDVDFLPPVPTTTPRLVLNALSARGLSNVSLEVKPGELLGIAGVDGNGQRELAEVLTGLRPWSSGTLQFEGRPVAHWTPAQARAQGVVHIPEDRLRRALVSELTVEENASLGRHRGAPFAKGGAIDFSGRNATTTALLTAHDVRPPDPQLRAGGLSGGNQQKLVVGRELEGTPKLIVAVQPTRGLDLAAVRGVRQQLLEKARAGAAVVLVSLDLEEVLALSDRLLVMVAGSVVAELKRADFDERVIGRHMLGVGVA